MAKVGRAAFNSSRKRVEAISADKTILSAEAGELYLIDHNAASALTITLPAMQDGAYFKFIVKTKLAADGTIVLKSSEATAGDFAGGVVEQVLDAADGAVSYQLAGAHHTLTLNDDVNIGSNIECVCDGSKWYITGTVLVEAVGPNAVFSA
jgi:hypothetical protein